MSTPFGAAGRIREDGLTRYLLNHPLRESESEFEFELEFEGEGELSPSQLADAMRANRVYARQIGWGCVIGDIVSPIPQLRGLLGLPAGSSEEDLARAVERWQNLQRGWRGDGKLGPQTWERMRAQMESAGSLPQLRFKQQRWPVYFGGRLLGVIEKSATYREINAGGAFGVGVEFGFRVTDMNAVRTAGFVQNGAPRFQWIQVVELRRIGNATAEPAIQRLRRQSRGRILDPTVALTTIDPTLAIDRHPYYWDEVNGELGFVTNVQGQNGLCYDLLFSDAPNISSAAALPGRRAYFNFETALVGIRPNRRNLLLNTILWGFDIILTNGVPALGVNAMRAGTTGGSAGLRRVLSDEVNAGSFDNHCFVGAGYARAATCT
jgi:hypothetical protein